LNKRCLVIGLDDPRSKQVHLFRTVHTFQTMDNRPSQAKYVASVTNCGRGLETAKAPMLIWDGNFSLTINTGNLSDNSLILHGD